MRQLQIAYDVELVSFFRREHQSDIQAVNAAARQLATQLHSIAEPAAIPAEHSILRRIADHLKSVITGKPYTYFEYYNGTFVDALDEALRKAPPDLVHVDSLDLYRWMEQIPFEPITCTHHSIESDLLRLRAKVIKNPVVSLYMRHQASLIEKVERRFAPAVNINIMMSDLDGDRLRQLAPDCRTVTVPNGVDVEFFRPAIGRRVPDRVVFLGPSYMLPNRDGIEFFLERVWPRIRDVRRSAVFQIIGKCSEAHRISFERNPGVSCMGFVKDIRPLLAEASCFVVPIRVGGGTRLKILEAWAMGCPVVSTAVGCEGLGAADEVNILMRDEPRDFAEAVLRVLRDGELQSRLGSAGRRAVVDSYGWPAIGERMREVYGELLCEV